MRNCIVSPSNLELLLHCHVSPEQHPRLEAKAIKGGLEYLQGHGMIERYDRTWTTTEKGKFYIEYILSIPFPEQSFRIPE